MPGQLTGAAQARILESWVGTSPVQEGQGKTGPAAIDESAAKKTPEVWLQFQILADEPPDLLWDFAVHFGRVDVSWCCTRPVVHNVVPQREINTPLMERKCTRVYAENFRSPHLEPINENGVLRIHLVKGSMSSKLNKKRVKNDKRCDSRLKTKVEVECLPQPYARLTDGRVLMSLSRGPGVRPTATESFSRSTAGGSCWVLVAPSCTSGSR